jgi:hypothetical protein
VAGVRLPRVLLVHAFNPARFEGSTVLLTLLALHLGASPVASGLLCAMDSLLPVGAGGLSDRAGCHAVARDQRRSSGIVDSSMDARSPSSTLR